MPKTNYKLLQVVFNIDKDCHLVLTPPAIYELLNYYEAMRKFAFKFNACEEILQKVQVKNFFESYVKYSKLLEKGRSNDLKEAEIDVQKKYVELANTGNWDERRIGGLAFALNISTPFGSKLLDESHNKLIGLFKNKNIIPLDQALENPLKINDIAMNMDTYDHIYKYLAAERPHSPINNIVDAELAAMSTGFNEKFLDEKIFMNVFTSSFKPSKALEVYRDRFNGPDLPRSPIYGLIRFCLYNKTQGDYEEMYNYSFESINHLKDLDKAVDVSKRAKGKPDSIDLETSMSLLKSSYYFLDLLLYKPNLSSDLADMIIGLNSNDKFNDDFKVILEQIKSEDKNNEALRKMETESIVDLINNPKGAEDYLRESQEKIVKSSENIFESLYEHIAAYDYNKLSPSMSEIYKIIGANKTKHKI
jgi:hypothetical protein